MKDLFILVFVAAITVTTVFSFFPQNTTHFIDSFRNYNETSQELKFTEQQLNQVRKHLKTGFKAFKPEETAWCMKTEGNQVKKLEVNKKKNRYAMKSTVKCLKPVGVIHTHPTLYGSFHPSQKDFENMKKTEQPDCIAHGKITVTENNKVKGLKCFNNQKQLMEVKKVG